MLPLALTLLVACGDGDTDSGATDDGHTHTDHGGSDSGAVDYSRTQDTDGGSWSVTWTPSIDPVPMNQNFDVALDVTPADGVSITRIDATMPAHGHGMNVTPELVDNGDGTATASPFNLHMEADWLIEVDVSGDAGTETASFHVMCCE
ncbi:MAG: hypothetical protein H6742_00610 [Alphaproteobacteria bacterium]|nr:hypothetical protein [Alphaproteobacteria bacterium]